MLVSIKNYSKAALAIILAVYLIVYSTEPENFAMVNGVFLSIHEAGHVFFSFFGQTLSILGGSVFQIIVPICLAGYFFFRGDFYSSAVVNMIVGASFINLSVYVKDAQAMALDLIGGEIHDWNFLLTQFGLLERTKLIGNAFFVIGLLAIIVSALVAIIYSFYINQSAKERKVLDILEN